MTVLEELGADGFVYGRCNVQGASHDITIRVAGRDTVRKGERIYVTTDPHQVHLFETETGLRIGD